ncbi:MAG: ParA family protein [Bradymonadia bacterium]
MAGVIGVRKLLSSGLDKLKQHDVGVRATGSKSAKVIAVSAQKGGVGKTTTTVNLACALAERGLSVLVIDVDAQGHVGSALREHHRTGLTSLSDILLSEKPRDLMECVLETDIDNLSITSADKRLSETDHLLSTRVGREYVLKGVLKNARSQFDIILIDCPPNLGNLTLNALVAADFVLVPCDMSLLAFEGVADLMSTVLMVIQRLGQELEVLGIVRTRFDGRTKQMNTVIGEALSDNYSSYLLDSYIPMNSALAKAQAAGISAFKFESRARGVIAYRDLAEEVCQRLALDKTITRAEM